MTSRQFRTTVSKAARLFGGATPPKMVYGYYITKPKATAFGKRRQPLAVPQRGGFVDTIDGNETDVFAKTTVSKAEWLFIGVPPPMVYGYYIML